MANDSQFFFSSPFLERKIVLFTFAGVFEKLELKGRPGKITQTELELCVKTQGNSAYRGEVLQKLICFDIVVTKVLHI